MSDKTISRRSFIKNSAIVSAAAIAAPSVIVHASENKKLPKGKIVSRDKVNVAFIGIGNRGCEDANGMYDTGLCNVVALCDVDMGAEHTLEIMNKFKGVPTFRDWRKMFDKMADTLFLMYAEKSPCLPHPPATFRILRPMQGAQS